MEVWVDRVAVGSGALNTTALGAVGCAGISLFAGGRHYHHSVQFSSVAQLCPTLCNPMDCSMPDLPVHHQLLEFTQTHVH